MNKYTLLTANHDPFSFFTIFSNDSLNKFPLKNPKIFIIRLHGPLLLRKAFRCRKVIRNHMIKYLLKKDDIELDDINLNNFKEDLYYLRWAPDFYSNIFRIINKERSLADFIKIMYQRLILIIKGKLIIEKFESFRWIFLILRQRNRWV